jgi:hypothetical protein
VDRPQPLAAVSIPDRPLTAPGVLGGRHPAQEAISGIGIRGASIPEGA